MNRRLRVLPEAEAELAAAAEWYEERLSGLGVALIATIDAALDQIRDAPDSCPVWRTGHPYRRLVVRRFPYIVFFTVPREGEVEVVAFAHAKRKPGYWLERSPSRPVR